MSSIIEFPIADKPITESEIDKLHGDAFRELETNLRDCAQMSGIAAEFDVECKGRGRPPKVRRIPPGRNPDGLGKGIRRQLAR